MKAIILAAGYGTRLQRDLENDCSGCFNHLKGLPKSLLPVGGKPLIDYLVDAMKECHHIDGIYVVTNEVYFEKFKEWADEGRHFPESNIVNDGSNSNETRLGAVRDIAYAVKIMKVDDDDDLLVVGGDTLFNLDFDLGKVIDYFNQVKGSVVLSYKVGDDEVHKRGICEFDENMILTNFLEKPYPYETMSRDASPAFYVYKREVVSLLEVFLQEKGVENLKEIDAPGKFLKWVHKKERTYGFSISGRFDVGNLEDYRKADKFFSCDSH